MFSHTVTFLLEGVASSQNLFEHRCIKYDTRFGSEIFASDFPECCQINSEVFFQIYTTVVIFFTDLLKKYVFLNDVQNKIKN